MQRVTLAPNAAYAVIGVRGGNAASVLKSLRLYVPATEAPMVLAGAGRAWGTRELAASAAYTLAPLAAGANAIQAVALPNLQAGDFVQASFAGPRLRLSRMDGGDRPDRRAGNVTARVGNRHGTVAIPTTSAAGTLFVRAVKPRA